MDHPFTNDDNIDIAFRALTRYFNTGWLWDEQAWMFMNPTPPQLGDGECRILAMEFMVTWKQLRAAFPNYTEYSETTLH